MPVHRKNSLAAWLPDLLGRAAQSSPEAASRRAKGAGLYGNGADRAILHPPPLTLKSSSRFPDAPTHAQPVMRQTGFEEKLRAVPGGFVRFMAYNRLRNLKCTVASNSPASQQCRKHIIFLP